MGRILRAVRIAVALAAVGAGLPAAGYLIARSVPVAAAQSAGQPEVVALSGAWRGSYTCAQGVTGLTLTIEAGPHGVTALFDFYAVPENPTVPAGRFKMAGFYDSNARTLTLHPREWLRQPPGYLTVGIRAHVDLEWGVMLGSVTGSTSETYGCTWVRLRRDRETA
jgi:hypothetical protein